MFSISIVLCTSVDILVDILLFWYWNRFGITHQPKCLSNNFLWPCLFACFCVMYWCDASAQLTWLFPGISSNANWTLLDVSNDLWSRMTLPFTPDVTRIWLQMEGWLQGIAFNWSRCCPPVWQLMGWKWQKTQRAGGLTNSGSSDHKKLFESKRVDCFFGPVLDALALWANPT